MDLDGHLGLVAQDRDHAHAGELATLRVVVLDAEHGVGVHDVPPARDLAEREQREGAQLVVEHGSGGEVVDLLAERRNRLAPALAGPLLEELDHLRGVLVDLGGVHGECHDEEVEDLAALEGLLVLVDLSSALCQDGADSCDVHRGYFLSVGNGYIIA